MVALTQLLASVEPARGGGTTLNGGINNSATTVVATGHTNFPSSGSYTIVIDNEHLQVTAGQGTNSWTVTRGFDGTTAASHTNGATIFLAPTRLQMLNGFFEETYTRYNPTEERGNFERFFRSIQTDTHAEIKGLTLPATYEDLAWWLQFFFKGGVTGALSNTSVYTYTFTPTLTADDLSTMRAVIGNDTQAYAIPYGIGNSWKFESQRNNQSAQLSMDFMGQRAIADVFPTTPLSQRVVEDVNPANSVAYIDSTTIGTTAAGNVTAFTATLSNDWQQLFFLNGLLYPTDAARNTRFLDVEIDVVFNNTNEYVTATTAPVERKIRLTSTGGTVAGSSPATSKSFGLDCYTYWDTSAFAIDKNVWSVKFKGRSVYDASAGNSFSATVVNGIAALP